MYTKTNKEIYRFTIFTEDEVEKEVDVEKEVEVEREVEVEKVRHNENGEEETYTETEVKKFTETQIVKEKRKESEQKEHTFIIAQPTRRQMEEADMEYSIEMSKCVKEGILTKNMLLNKYSDVGGIMSEEEAKKLGKMYAELSELQTRFTAFKIKESNPDNFEGKQKEVYEKMSMLRRDITTMETNFSSLLSHTADTRAQNKVISWYLLSLTKTEDEDGNIQPFFNGDTFEEKKEHFYELEENEDPLLSAVYEKLTAFISFWYFSVSTNLEDFESLEKDIDSGNF